MNVITQWKVNRRIVERSKLLILFENTYKHKEKRKENPEGEGKGRSGE
jgi:hypothetical protein